MTAEQQKFTPVERGKLNSEASNSCPACLELRYHTEEEKKNHPLMGHGLMDNRQWSHPDLVTQAENAKQKTEEKAS